MNTLDLKSRLSFHKIGYGCYKVILEYRRNFYYCMSNNSLAYDRITGYADDISDRVVRDFYTYKGALRAFYDECKRANGL